MPSGMPIDGKRVGFCRCGRIRNAWCWCASCRIMCASDEAPMRKVALLFIVAVAVAILWLPLRKPPTHRLTLTTYFRNGGGLQPKAPVRVDGVELGSVTSVRVRPELGERPVEVIMAIATSYDLAIPSDSVVLLATGGLLGPTLVDIDTRRAQGSRIGNNGVLTSSELTDEKSNEANRQAARAMNRLADAVTQATTKSTPSDKQTTAKPSDPHK
jgi:ABC-type transporter Mla subunit MlaD